MKRRLPLAALALLAVAALAFRAPLDTQIDLAVRRAAARRALAGMNLPPTHSNVDLFLSIDSCPAIRSPYNPALAGRADARPPIPDSRPFSSRWSYGQLPSSGVLDVGVYCADPAFAASIDRIARDCSAPLPSNRWIQIHLLRSRDDLLRSLALDSFVLYFGHANLGRGIEFSDPTLEPPISLDDPSLRVGCRAFAYLGCRTDNYYRAAWHARHPRTDFVATTYVCHAAAMAPELLRRFVWGLHQGSDLAAIVDSFNQISAHAILHGRVQEIAKYANPSNHPPVLFTQ